MIILCQNTLLLKEFLAGNGCFGLFSKTKKGSGASFWSTFSAWFFDKNVPFLILYQSTTFQRHNLFLSQDIKQNVLLSSYLASWWQGKKGEKTKIQKFEYLENEKSFFDEIKNIFHSFWRTIFWWKIKLW